MVKFASLTLAVAAALGGLSAAQAAVRNDVVDARSSEYFTYYADPGETFAVDLSGDGTSDLDLFVRGPGGLVCRQIGRSDDESCAIHSPRGGHYRIEVRNIGSVWNDFYLAVY